MERLIERPIERPMRSAPLFMGLVVTASTPTEVGPHDAAAMLCHPCTGVLWIAVEWSLSRRSRNRAMHALHGNGGPPWQFVKRTPGEARMLQELQTVDKLRSMGLGLRNFALLKFQA